MTERYKTTEPAVLRICRKAHLFVTQSPLMDSFKNTHERVVLAPDQLVHPPIPADYVVRRGQIRISQFLPNGREVTRAVLQAGAFFTTRQLNTSYAKQTPNNAADIYILADIVVMSLDEAVLWSVPSGSFDKID